MTETGWNLPAPPNFHGLREDQPVHFYHRHLPHWRQCGATYFVTFRQSDSLPQEKLKFLKRLQREWQQENGPPKTAVQWYEYSRVLFRNVENFLDQGLGSCRLREVWASQTIDSTFRFFDQQRYELGCFVVMPNHVHAILRPTLADTFPLEKILQSWKRASAYEIHRRLQGDGPFWQEESFDRIIRDEEHLYRCVQYVGRNPKKAKITEGEYRLWINPQWVQHGWRFEN